MSCLKAVFVTVLVIFSAAYSEIRPLFAGTIELDDHILRSNTCIFKTLSLPLTKSQYEAKNINAIAAISSMSMDKHLSFQFRYEILCPAADCFIDFAFTRYTERVREDFEYQMKIDFLVAQGLQTSNLNMTFYKADLNLNHLPSKSQIAINQERQNGWEIFLVPNGFNNVVMTGRIIQTIDSHLSKLFVLYEDQANGHGAADFMGWALNQHFILYKVIFIPKQYLKTQNQCQSLQFSGFLSTNQDYLQFASGGRSRNHAQFSIPIHCSEYFKDQRLQSNLVQARTSVGQNLQSNYFYAIVPFLIAQVAYIFYRKKYPKRTGQNNEVQLPDLLISFETTHIVLPKELESKEACETNSNILKQATEPNAQ